MAAPGGLCTGGVGIRAGWTNPGGRYVRQGGVVRFHPPIVSAPRQNGRALFRQRPGLPLCASFRGEHRGSDRIFADRRVLSRASPQIPSMTCLLTRDGPEAPFGCNLVRHLQGRAAKACPLGTMRLIRTVLARGFRHRRCPRSKNEFAGDSWAESWRGSRTSPPGGFATRAALGLPAKPNFRRQSAAIKRSTGEGDLPCRPPGR